MAHSAPPAPRRRWYEIAGGIAILVLAVAIGLVAVLAVRHHTDKSAESTVNVPSSSAAVPSTSVTSIPAPSTSSPVPPASSPASSPATQTNPALRPAVIVLNNTGQSSLTGLAVSRLRAGGWTATDGGAFDGAILSTAVYYDPASEGAQQAAAALQTQFPQVKRVKEKFTGLPEGPLVLVVTDDYS
jgi:cytoskeletal protein RodZ